MRRQDGWVRLHASDQDVGVQKFESGLLIGTLIHQIEVRAGLSQCAMQPEPDSRNSGILHRSVCNRPELHIPASALTSPPGYECFVRGGRVVVDQWIARLHVAKVQIPVRVCDMRGCGIRAVGQGFLDRSDNLVLAQLRDGDAVE